MKVKLLCCESTLLSEIANIEVKKNDIAQTYRLTIESGEDVNWEKVNEAIITRWSRAGLKDIKKLAWSGKCFNHI